MGCHGNVGFHGDIYMCWRTSCLYLLMIFTIWSHNHRSSPKCMTTNTITTSLPVCVLCVLERMLAEGVWLATPPGRSETMAVNTRDECLRNVRVGDQKVAWSGASGRGLHPATPLITWGGVVVWADAMCQLQGWNTPMASHCSAMGKVPSLRHNSIQTTLGPTHYMPPFLPKFTQKLIQSLVLRPWH